MQKDDKISLSVDAFYFGTDSEDNVGAAAILPYIVGAFAGQGVVDGQALAEAIELGGRTTSGYLAGQQQRRCTVRLSELHVL